MSSLNQVTPSGALVEVRGNRGGLLMGNRGILQPKHFEQEQPYALKAWIACVLKDRNNIPIPPSDVKYTKLFFLDEVTAFAAGHRPCGQCQRKRYGLFVEVWGKATGLDTTKMDAFLQTERIDTQDNGGKPNIVRKLGSLPSGAMVTLTRNGPPYLLLWGKLFPWSVGGYGKPVTMSPATEVQLLTPPSIIETFLAGFPLPINADTTIHASVLDYAG